MQHIPKGTTAELELGTLQPALAAAPTRRALGQEYGAKWYCAGASTKKGHPHHPLYLKKDEKLKPFDISAYLDTL